MEYRIYYLLILLLAGASILSTQALEEIKQTTGGIFNQNATLFFRNSPYRVTKDIVVESGVTLTVETGVQLFFEPGIGIKVKGTLYAVGGKWSRIRMLPYQKSSNHEVNFPRLRLIDGPSTRQGRLQVLFRDRWRSVCTQNTNWTTTDFSVACTSMGYGGGGFWQWFRRNNDTYPFVMPRPGCRGEHSNLWDCDAWTNTDRIPLAENLCQGEDDVGIICWGPPTFEGWKQHWKGLEFLNVPFEYVNADPDKVSVMKQSLSRLEYVDIEYAGYDKTTQNSTAAIVAQGLPPFMNDLHILYSARDGIRVYEADGPILIANSTVNNNRGHGIVIDNTTDGRVFLNETRVEFNYGDGVRYRHKVGSQLQVLTHGPRRLKRQSPYYEQEKPRINLCREHQVDVNYYFPHFVEAFLPNGTQIGDEQPCYLVLHIPPRLRFVYTIQFISVQNKNHKSLNTDTNLLICYQAKHGGCGIENIKIPIYDGIIPQSFSLDNKEQPLWIGLTHYGAPEDRVFGDIRVQFRVHATVRWRADVLYGLNITNSRISSNIGAGVVAFDVRDRLVITNVTISENQGTAAVKINNGAADIWINDTHILDNWGDGINVSYVGGAVTVNSTTIMRNRMRGAAFHQNTSSPFMNLRQDIFFKGRPSNQRSFLPTVIGGNLWGGILVGNFCSSHLITMQDPSVIVSYVELVENKYHPAFEFHSCQRKKEPVTRVEMSGSRCERGSGYCVRIEPAVNIKLEMTDNRFLNNSKGALLIRNRHFPQLKSLPADVRISKNQFKFNRGPFIVSIGLNEDAADQRMVFNVQNELRENTVSNPYPHLKPRNNPYAALIVSSSNVQLRRNCFRNPKADFEIATDLSEHAKWIDAKENNWGSQSPATFMPRIYDQFNRYSLAIIDIDPFAATCNSQNPHITSVLQYYRPFRSLSEPYVLGGAIYENTDLDRGTYTIVNDLHVIPGAKLSIAPGTVLQFQDSVGMLVQGELTRTDFIGSEDKVTFTRSEFSIPLVEKMRLVDEEGNFMTTQGRLEVFLDGQWGTVCNRSWTVDLAAKACRQLGMVIDPEFLENWRLYPAAGPLPIIMDIIRCEENEWDLTQCRHDGADHNVNISCKPWNVVGVRCVEPHWAGVRYSLLANPPYVTGQSSMNRWIIEKAGLFDYLQPEFSAALQIDWNYHFFSDMTIRNNFWNGLDIVYNDLTKKPKVFRSEFYQNRRHGVRIRSVGLTMEEVSISDNDNAGVRYNPIISAALQRDVVTWLDRRELRQMEANNVFVIPMRNLTHLTLSPSGLNQRKFLVAKATSDCPQVPSSPCVYELNVDATSVMGGAGPRIGVQIVNRASNISDENIIFTTGDNKYWDMRRQMIHFPLRTDSGRLRIQYSRSYGPPTVVVLLLFFERAEYLDRFVHVYRSSISNNQYGISTLHYSNFTHWDGSILNRWDEEQLWFQKVNFTKNRQAVVWVNGPLRDVHSDSPIATIGYHIDNCSITVNNGSIIETHRDLHSSANVFAWKIWKSTISGNDNSGISIQLPDTYDLRATKTHSFNVTENRFLNNKNFMFELSGYYGFVNISSNNFTTNKARPQKGLMLLRGMEKQLVMQRNRWQLNRGAWVLKYYIQSQTVSNERTAPARIQYNYFDQNYFLDTTDQYVSEYPRSYALGVFGLQKVNVNYNQFRNILMDFECVVGLKGSELTDSMNVSHNWWGTGLKGEIGQRIFDFDDWNIFSVAQYNPYYVTQEKFIDWWWRPEKGQLDSVTHIEPSGQDLHGRMFESVTLPRLREKWPTFPHYYKPDRPYFISKDLTIMPGATLTIEKGVEVHLYPNVRILVLGALLAEGTFLEPIRFKPINVTELAQITEGHQSRWKRSVKEETKRDPRAIDSVYEQFPMLRRQDSFYQKFEVFLIGPTERSGFLEIYNATTGEMVPICDRQFTRRNAQVVCKELGFPTLNTYVWIGARWDYDPKIRIVRSYSEPRQCMGDEQRMSDCDLRLNGDRDLWYCVDSEHFVFIHCGEPKALNWRYVGHWGGIVFSADDMEKAHKGSSVLRNVEIVGAGLAHNDSSSALEMIYQTPVLDHVNVTNSSMHAIQIIAPRNKVVMNAMNVSHNNGVGINVLSLNLEGSTSSTGTPIRNLSFPYHLFGLMDMCSVGKTVRIESRVLLYYKYDSYPVDCIKYFTTNSNRDVGFRILQANLYNPHDPAGRPDAIRFYKSYTMTRDHLIGLINYDTPVEDFTINSPTNQLAVHMRATAADGKYGFIAEVTALPAAPGAAPVQEVSISSSRFENNDRGALHYSSAGESSPNLLIDSTYFANNGYHIWANLSTCTAAVDLELHNTQVMNFQNNMLWRNQGGLRISAQSTTSVARLSGLIKNSVFASNEYFETLRLEGKDFQKIFVINNYFGKNRARYHDIVFVNRMTTNFTRNVFYNNTGTHIVDMTGYPRVRTEYQTFRSNYLYNNIALGHGYQYGSKYGYLPRRRKRETSFDWWTHIGADTERYRSTVLAGSSQQHYELNFFNNPLNDFELTTVNKTDFDVNPAPLFARNNYWGYPGTAGVASGKIRDEGDYQYLIAVDYLPVLESNTSLLQGDCPGGWFQAGVEEFKSCFLFVGGAMPYDSAVDFCRGQDAFIPYFRASDSRIEEVSNRVDAVARELITEPERYSKYKPKTRIDFWVSGVAIPSGKCGYLSTESSNIREHNCMKMLPFVCEKGTKPYQEPFLWRGAGLAVVLASIILLLLLILLAVGWWLKSKRRKKQFFERKASLRNSIRSSLRKQQERQQQDQRLKDLPRPSERARASPDLIAEAHRNMVIGPSLDSLDDVSSFTPKKRADSKSSLDTTLTDTTSSYPEKKGSSIYTESAYRSDYSPSESYYTMSARSDSTQNHIGTPEKKLSAAKPALSSFQSPERNGNGSVNGVNLRQKKTPARRHDTDLSQMSSTTYCSTCPTESSGSYTDRGSGYTASTITEETASARSSSSSADTIEADVPPPVAVRAPPRVPRHRPSLLQAQSDTVLNDPVVPILPKRPNKAPPPIPKPSRSMTALDQKNNEPPWPRSFSLASTACADRTRERPPPQETNL